MCNFTGADKQGSLPKVLAKYLIENKAIEWEKWEIFFADERAVKLSHEDSNYALLKTELLDKIGASQPHVYTINEGHLDDLTELADEYEQHLIKSFAAKDSVRLPIFDAILLGCGPDGHTGSLFPGHKLLREAEGWVLNLDDSPKPPPKRITFSLPVICAALRIAYVATGEGKQDILETVFDSPEKGLPCSLVNEGAGEKVVWFTDSAANAKIKSLKKPWRGVEHIPRRGSI